MQNKNSLISIERVVAFVLGPVVVAGSGTLSAWLSTKVGIQVSPGSLSAAFATGGASAGAAVWKWLHGRQQAPIVITGAATHVYDTVTNTLHEIGVPVEVQRSVEQTVLDRVEQLAQSTAEKVVAQLPKPADGFTFSSSGQPVTPPSADPASPPAAEAPPVAAPEPEPIEQASGDPAPATPVQAEEAVPDAVEQPPVPQSAVTPDGGALSPGAENAPDAGEPTPTQPSGS